MENAGRKRRPRLDNANESTALIKESKQDNYAKDNAVTSGDNSNRPSIDSHSGFKGILLPEDIKESAGIEDSASTEELPIVESIKPRSSEPEGIESMDDGSEWTTYQSRRMKRQNRASSTSDLSVKSCYTPPEKTTVYYPLPAYQTLNLDMGGLYQEFFHYLLTEEQLRANCFPEERPDRPGRILIYRPGWTNPDERCCVRCSRTFHIGPDGTYRPDNGTCRYHPRKQLPYRRGHPYTGDYPCCNGDYMSEGCVTWQYHVTAESFLGDVEFVRTKSKRHLKKKQNCVYGLDCEMLYTTAGLEVGKVGLVSAEGLTVFESFVLPQSQILDYNTTYSGITERDLKGVTMTLDDVQAYLLKLLNEDTILVGHGLENDLRALRLVHRKVVDTSIVFPHDRSPRFKKSLKNLALEFLGKQIQTSSNGHNCIEDARTCMELMLLRISLDRKNRSAVSQDENKSSILLNTVPSLPTTPQHHQPAEYVPAQYVYDSWPYSYSSYCGNSYRGENSGFLMPKIYQNSCIY